MRHKIKTDRFSRFSSYRKATIKSIVLSLLLHQKIITTKAKAKSARILAEKLITLAKKNNLAAKRAAFALLGDHALVSVLFKDITPQFTKRNGGYTRIIPYRNRRGDNAKLVILELTERAEKKIDKDKGIDKKAAKDALGKDSARLKEEKDRKKDSVPLDTESRQVLPSEETKPHAHPEEGQKHKRPDDKKPKKFGGGFKGFFKRERDSL